VFFVSFSSLNVAENGFSFVKSLNLAHKRRRD